LRHRSRAAWLAALAWLIALAVGTSAAFAQVVAPTERVTHGVVIRAQPLAGSDPLGTLRPGDSAPLTEDAPGWRGVRLPDGRTGYVSKAWTVVVGGSEPGVPAAAAPIYRLHAVDVGTGLALFVEGPDFALVYDAGSNDDMAKGARDRFVAYLRKVRPDLTTIDHLIASHPHQDHLSMLPDVLKAYRVRNVWESGRFFPSCVYRDFLEAIAGSADTLYHQVTPGTGDRPVAYGKNCNRDARTLILHRGAEIDAEPVALGAGARMTFLYRDATDYEDPNGNSLVTRLDLGPVRILLTGDAEAGARRDPAAAPDPGSAEARLLACCRTDLRADVLVAGHHGSKTSSRRAFLDAVGATTFVISSGPHLYSGTSLPDPEIRLELEGRGVLLRTNLDDMACAQNPTKIGPDKDGKPGGCDNVVITVQGAQVTADYLRLSD
jgi:competence protein ComEC